MLEQRITEIIIEEEKMIQEEKTIQEEKMIQEEKTIQGAKENIMATMKNNTSQNKGGRKKREPGEGAIYTIANYIFWMFTSNIYFLLVNIPIIYVLLALVVNGSTELSPELAGLLLLCCVPVGPAATALFSVMGKLSREKDLNVTRDFFKAYKVNFLQSIFLWTASLVVLSLLSFDARIALAGGWPKVAVIGIYIAIAYVAALMLYVLAIVSRFYLKSKDVIKLAIYYSIRKPHITLVNLASLGLVVLMFVKATSFIMLFVFSLIAMLIMFNLQSVLADIQAKVSVEPSKKEEKQQ